MFRPMFNKIMVGFNSIYSSSNQGNKRWVYNFDGIDDRGVLATRAINIEGDNTFEFWTPIALTPNVGIISQNIVSAFTSREFELGFSASGALQVVFGGVNTAIYSVLLGMKPATRYGLTLIGTTAQVFEGGLSGTLVRTTAFTRGTAREPTAPTLIGCRGNGSGAFASFFSGLQYDIKINGTLWPISDRNQSIQLPSPSGLGAELVTQSVLENPESVGSQWSYLGGGRWSYVGDGTFNALRFIAIANLPSQGFMEYEVESINGSLRCSANSAPVFGDRLISTTGVKRVYYTSPVTDWQFVRNNPGQVVNCIIKNISFKPLNTCNPLTLVNTTPDRWEEIEGTLPKTRWVYNFDGVDDRGELNFKAVNMDGDNSFEFWTPTGVTASDQQIIAQNVNSGGASSEFRIAYVDTGTFRQIGVTWGGSTTIVITQVQGLKKGTKYGLTLIGTEATIYEGGLDGTFIRSVTLTRGAIREATATTTIMARRAGTLTSFVQYASGVQRDVKINGVLYAIDAPYQTVQLPNPTGLGTELITQSVLENPANKATQWTYLGDGRWRLQGTGAYESLRFISDLGQVAGLMIEFEVESITGTLRLNPITAGYWVGNNTVNQSGKYRLYSNSIVANNLEFVRHNGGEVVNCVIKNISFKLLGTCNPLALINTTPDRWIEVLE
jgi:hypothetical protein